MPCYGRPRMAKMPWRRCLRGQRSLNEIRMIKIKQLMMKYYFLVIFLLGSAFGAAAQGKPVMTTHDPDDSIVVEKNKASSGSVSAPWRWAVVDADFGALPSGVHVYRTVDSLDGRPQVAYYVSA